MGELASALGAAGFEPPCYGVKISPARSDSVSIHNILCRTLPCPNRRQYRSTRSDLGKLQVLSFKEDRTLPHRELSPTGSARRGRVARLFFDQKKLAGFDVVKKTKDIHVPWRPARSSHAAYVAM